MTDTKAEIEAETETQAKICAHTNLRIDTLTQYTWTEKILRRRLTLRYRQRLKQRLGHRTTALVHIQ